MHPLSLALLSHIQTFPHAQWFIHLAVSASALTCQSQCALTTAHIFTHTLMQHFFSGYSQTDWEVHSYISKLCATIQTSTDKALKATARLNIILYSTKTLSGNTPPWLISAADLEPSDKCVPACVEMRNLRPFPFYAPKRTTQTHYRLIKSNPETFVFRKALTFSILYLGSVMYNNDVYILVMFLCIFTLCLEKALLIKCILFI